MSRVEGYDLHVYCDAALSQWEHRHTDQFCGINRADAYRLARAAGWKLTAKGDYCPTCNRKSPLTR